jgi:hypothetical protein
LFFIRVIFDLQQRWAVCFFLCLMALVAGCNPLGQRTPLACPTPPVPLCEPGSFDKVLLDTVFHGPGRIQSHVTMVPGDVNSSADDNAIAFLPSGDRYVALISSSRNGANASEVRGGVQRVYSATFNRTTEFGAAKDVQSGEARVPFGGGFYSPADHLFYFAGKANNDDPDDYDIYTGRPAVVGDEVSLSDVHPVTSLNLRGHFDSQPTLDPTGHRIYFVSDRPGGSGGTDIWYAERASTSGESWSEPRPLPPPVNTECDELSPFIASSSDPVTFYFSSNGHATVGGYDLFRTTIRNGQFSEPQNLGIPINTKFDEIFPTAVNDTAFFWASNMPASESGMNIYTITRNNVPTVGGHGQLPSERPETRHLEKDTTPQGPVDVEIAVTRGPQHRPAEGSEVFVRKDSVEIHRKKLPANGHDHVSLPRAEYEIGAETQDAFFDVRKIDLRNYRDSVATIELHLPDTLVLRINFPFDDYQHPYEYVIDENGQPSTMTCREALDLTAQSVKGSIDRLRELILIGHTDSLGSDDYNDRLGFRRATFVSSELVRRGLPKNLIRVLSKGRTQPVARRPDESDELFRLRCRRVEFVKVFK